MKILFKFRNLSFVNNKDINYFTECLPLCLARFSKELSPL